MKLYPKLFKSTTAAEFALHMFHKESAYARRYRGERNVRLARLFAQFARRWYSDYIHESSMRESQS